MNKAGHISASERPLKVLTLLCIVLIAVVGVVQVTHVHSDESKIPSHECSMCAVAHAGILNNIVSPPTPLFVETTLVIVHEPISITSEFVSSYRIRPPPAV